MTLRINALTNVIQALCLGTILILMDVSLYCQDFYKKHAEGWFWYQDPPAIGDDEAKRAKNDESQKATSPQTPLNTAEKAKRQMDTFKKQLEDLKVIALVNPTSANVAAYMHHQKEMLSRSERFSAMWQQVVLTNPDLNPEVSHPTAQFAKPIVYDRQENRKKQLISNLSKTHGLIYFFKGNCPYCTGFAPIVTMFAERYNWQVMAVSMDGSSSDVFPEARPDNGIGDALKIQSVPVLVAYNAETNQVIPISYAMTSMDQLENNVMALVGGNQ